MTGFFEQFRVMLDYLPSVGEPSGCHVATLLAMTRCGDGIFTL